MYNKTALLFKVKSYQLRSDSFFNIGANLSSNWLRKYLIILHWFTKSDLYLYDLRVKTIYNMIHYNLYYDEYYNW